MRSLPDEAFFISCLFLSFLMIVSFRPKYVMRLKLIKYWMANILSEKKVIILGKWGLRKAFFRNSLKQHFNGGRQPSVNNFNPRHIDSI